MRWVDSAGIKHVLYPTSKTSNPNNFNNYAQNNPLIYSDGDIVNHDNSYGSTSDERIKEGIRDANSQWDDVKALTVLGKNFRMKADVAAKGDDAPTLLGLVAQDVEAISPGLVEHNTESSFPHRQLKDSVMYMKAFFALGEAMNRIEALEAKVAALEAG